MERKIKHISSGQFLVIVMIWMHILVALPYGLEKRARWEGLYKTISSSTIGKENMFLSMYGRGFLWDNNAAQNAPTAIPHFEIGYGVLDFVHVSGGGQIMTTKPSSAFLKLKVTTPNTKNIRFLGLAQTVEIYRNLLSEFKSAGYRYKNEGFSPDFFMTGNDNLITSFKLMTAFDIETIKISSYMPFKFYLNLGFEGGGSWVAQNIKKIWKSRSQSNDVSYRGSTNFQKIPMRIGAELKTQSTDFFMELEADPFLEHWKSIFRNGLNNEAAWVRFNFVAGNDSNLTVKAFDVHMFETPIYINAGGRLKYPNGITIQGGASWLLSRDLGPKIGPCGRENKCKDGATDGFAPFNPQWRLFGRMTIPLRFQQTSAELVRTYLLRRNSKTRKIISIDDDLKKKGMNIDEIESENGSSGLKQINNDKGKTEK